MIGLQYPLRRVGTKGEGKFERVSWEEAIGEIAARFGAIASSEAGPQAILPYSYYGTMGKLQSSSLDRRFFHRLGASKLDRTICASAGTAGYEYTIGRGRLGADPMAVPECKLILNWGSNTVQHEQPPVEPDGGGAEAERGDDRDDRPVSEPDGRAVGLACGIRPGTDAALALGMMHVIWREGLQDEEYLRAGDGGGQRAQGAGAERVWAGAGGGDHGGGRRARSSGWRGCTRGRVRA